MIAVASLRKAFRAVLSKELVDGLRDRRALSMALLMPLLGPAVLGFSLSAVSKQLRAGEEEPVPLPVVGREHAPNLVAFLEEGNVEVRPPPADPEAAVRSGDADVVLIVPEEFGARLREGRPAPLTLVTDESRQAARAAIERTRRLLEAWGHRLGAQRLVVRGIHPAVVQPLALEVRDLATAQSRAGIVLGALPYFLVMAIFLGGMSIAIDATAGERERGSLEPLLLNPAPRAGLVLGKIAATTTFSALALAETLLAFSVLPLALPPERLGFVIKLDPGMLLRTFVLLLPLLAAAAALMVVVAARQRSFKAAQTTISLLMLVPALPGLMLSFLPVKPRPHLFAIPGFSEQLVVSRLVRGDPVTSIEQLTAMGASLALAVLLALAAVRLFSGERLLFEE